MLFETIASFQFTRARSLTHTHTHTQAQAKQLNYIANNRMCGWNLIHVGAKHTMPRHGLMAYVI
jgi:hypothetical protein